MPLNLFLVNRLSLMLGPSRRAGCFATCTHGKFGVSTKCKEGVTNVTAGGDYLLESSPTLSTAKNAS